MPFFVFWLFLNSLIWCSALIVFRQCDQYRTTLFGYRWITVYVIWFVITVMSSDKPSAEALFQFCAACRTLIFSTLSKPSFQMEEHSTRMWAPPSCRSNLISMDHQLRTWITNGSFTFSRVKYGHEITCIYYDVQLVKDASRMIHWALHQFNLVLI